MSHQPPSAHEFHGRAATLLDTPGGVTEPQALVALADAATGLLGLCIQINSKDDRVDDLETRLDAVEAVYSKLVDQYTEGATEVALRPLIEELRVAQFGPSVEDF